MKNKILITGGSGGIGISLVKRLAKENEVIVLDHKITQKFPRGVKVYECDLTKLRFKKFLKNIDFIFHLACIKPSFKGTTRIEYLKNSVMTTNLAKLNPGAKIIYPSAGTIYGIAKKFPIKENKRIICSDYYCLSKSKSEKTLRHYSKLNKWPLVILRISNVYGSDLKRSGEILPAFFEAFMKNKPLQIHGDGQQKRDRIWIEDLVDAFLLSMKKEVEGIFNIGSGKSYSTIRIAQMMEKLLKKSVPYFYQKSKDLERKDNLLDISKAKKILGFQPKIKFEKGLKILLNDWKKHRIFKFKEGI